MLLQADTLRIDAAEDGTATLWIDVPDQRYNILNRQLRADLAVAVDTLRKQSTLRAVVIRSAKESGFLAGADLNEFTTIRSAEAATASSQRGQELFQQLADLPTPTIAVIHGPCLGGGLELALACDYRIGVDAPNTLIGLPEVELGIVPGWGGTQRLPRVIGLERAFQMVLGAKKLNAQQCRQFGLVDEIVAPDDVLRAINQLIAKGVQKADLDKRRVGGGWRDWFLNSTWLGRRLAFRGAKKYLERRVPDDMPAPFEALKAMKVGFLSGMPAGLDYERTAIGRLSQTPACRNLVRLFFARENSRKVPAEYRLANAPEIRRVGIVGAGTMGAGIAQLAAIKNFDVTVQEISESALQAGTQRIESLFQQAAERRIITTAAVAEKMRSLGRTTTWQGFDQLDLIVEAAIEDLSAKRAVFQEIERRVPPETIIATNTSSLLVREIAEGMQHPERVAALHFFNPVHKMPLIEIACTDQTDGRTKAALVTWAVALGKTPVVVKDSPGFVVNRVLMPYFYEALRLLHEGASIQAIDRALQKFGMPMGPLELLDEVGLDVAAHVTKTLEPHFGTRFEPLPLLEKMTKEKVLGAKTGRGFYLRRGKKSRPNPRVAQLLGGGGRQRMAARAIQDRLVLLMVNEAVACVGEGIASEPQTIDISMIFGTGWAPHRGGPLRYADQLGVANVVRKLEALRRHGRHFEPHAELVRRAKADERFYGDD